jgi:hypothetical protein
MKKIFFIVSVLFLALPFYSFSQKNEKKQVEGSGNIVTKDIAVQPFSELKASGVFNIYLEQGNSESVKIVADDNFQPLFEVKNEGSKLVIRMQDDINIKTKKGSKGMKIYITFKTLKNMDLSTVGSTSSDKKLTFEDLAIKNSSVGSISLILSARSVNIKNESVGTIMLSGNADEATIKNSGVGSLKAYDFVVQKMEINNEGIGSAEVNAEKELKVKDSFLGKVVNKGAAKRVNKVVI